MIRYDAIQLFLEHNSTIAVNQMNDNIKWHSKFSKYVR